MIAKAQAPSPRRQTTFAPGARVVVRDEEWIVRGTESTTSGGVAVKVTGLSELVRGKEAIFLTELDEVIELRPEETKLVRDTSPGYRRSKLYLESLLRRTPPTDDRLHIGHHGAMRSAPYQLRPAHMALGQPRPRILIADGVGLGKTIEVGVLLSELIQRGRGERILVVGLKSILAQFQQELWARFTIPLVRLDSVGIQRVRANLPSNVNPFYHFPKVIISIDTLKSDARYRSYLEQCHWDVIVIDEAQHVALRGSKSQRARLAQLLGRTSDALILTSATPHDGRAESFASLMNLLEPTAIADPSNYTKEDIKGLFVRRFKRDIAAESGDAFHTRKVTIQRVDASDAEDAALLALSKAEFQTIDQHRTKGGGALFRTLLIKAFLSSPTACASTLNARIGRLQKAERKAGDDQAHAAREHDIEALHGLLGLVEAVTPEHLSKLERLNALIRSFGYSGKAKGERIVIFSERIQTLEFLREHLCQTFKLDEQEVAVFHGTLDDQEQQRLVKDFGTKDTKVRILLGSDAASEGINLHFFCHRLIHFDIPWSLITLEQRNGRIDRFGQEEDPDFHYLLTIPKAEGLRGDLHVLETLIKKEEEAHKNIGDAAFLMKQYEAEKEEVQIAKVIEGEVAEAEVLPDVEDAIRSDDLFSLLMSDTHDHQTEAEGELTANALSLYSDDLNFAEEAFRELAQSYGKEFAPPEPHPHLRGFTFTKPEDLKVRYRALPSELRTESGEVKLTVDRERVEKALEAARQSEAAPFPEWELFWPLHPVAQWLHDRVLAHFGRHEAPVLELAGLGPNEVVMVFQGIYSNKRSQPLIVQWFGVVFESGSDAAMIEDLEHLVARTGLATDLSNPKGGRPVDPLFPQIPFALKHAQAFMQKQRAERQAALVEQLKVQQRRLNAWSEQMSFALDAKEAKAGQGPSGAPAHVKKRIDDERSEAKKRLDARKEWLNNSLQTVEPPYLRLAAVLTGRA